MDKRLELVTTRIVAKPTPPPLRSPVRASLAHSAAADAGFVGV